MGDWGNPAHGTACLVPLGTLWYCWGPSELEDLVDEPREVCKAFSSTTSSKRERMRYWSSSITCVRYPVQQYSHSIFVSEILYLMDTCTSCAGDTGGFSEDTTVLLYITSVSITAALCEEIVGLQLIAAVALRRSPVLSNLQLSLKAEVLVPGWPSSVLSEKLSFLSLQGRPSSPIRVFLNVHLVVLQTANSCRL